MTEFLTLLVHPSLIGKNLFFLLVLFMVGAVMRIREPERNLFWLVVLCASFGLAGMWHMQQEYHVLQGNAFPTPNQSTAVPLRGVVRYVSWPRAFAYEYGLLMLFAAGFGVVALERFFSRRKKAS
jgi:hypothetical protein